LCQNEILNRSFLCVPLHPKFKNNMQYWWFLIPFLTACTGWLIHRCAAGFLFRPLTTKNFLGLRIQGWLPANRQAMAEKLGTYAASQFQAMDEIEKKIGDPATLAKVMPSIEVHIDEFLRVKLAEKMPVISMFIGDKTIHTLKTVFLQELENLFPKVMGQFAGNLRQDLDIKKIITEKIAAIPDAQLEAQVRTGLSGFFPKFYLLGAFTGFVAGVVALVGHFLFG
jgi:uncharacterized membrane protein YheB (UPF0754 family)